MIRRIMAFLVLLPASPPSSLIPCKSNCQMPMHVTSLPSHSCCHRSNDQVRGDDASSINSDARSAGPMSDPDCCRLSNPAPRGLQPRQVSRVNRSLIAVSMRLTFVKPGGGASPRSSEAMGWLQEGVETHASLQITPLRI